MGIYKQKPESLSEHVRQLVEHVTGVAVSESQSSEDLTRLGLDSLDQVEIVLAVEEEFEVEIPDELFDQITSVDALVGFLKGRNIPQEY